MPVALTGGSCDTCARARCIMHDQLDEHIALLSYTVPFCCELPLQEAPIKMSRKPELFISVLSIPPSRG